MTVNLSRETIEQDVDLARTEALLQEWRLELLHMAERVTMELNEVRCEVSDDAANLVHVAWAQDLGPRFRDALATLAKMQGLWRQHMQRVQKGHTGPRALTRADIYAQQAGAHAD